MLLPHFIKLQQKIFGKTTLALFAALFLAACGSTPQPAATLSSDTGAVRADGSTAPTLQNEIPAQAQTMYEQAVAVMASGDFLEAQLRFQEFLLQYPQYPGAYINLAIIFSANDDDLAAENSLTDALIIDPQNAAALNQLGMLQRRQGKFAQAESAYSKAVAAHPNYALAYYNLGVLNELYLQDYSAALQYYEQYQSLVSNEDKQVSKWIADLKRRIGVQQRTANVTE